MTSEQPTTDVETATSEAHQHVLDALPDRGGDGAAAVAWASAHLAAADQVLYAAAHSVPAARQSLRTARGADHRLQQALFRLDRRLTGDVHLDSTPVARVAAEVRDALAAHTRAERRVVDALRRSLPAERLAELGPRLVAATADAPTRPHPHTPHTPAAPLVAWVDAAVDRIRDVLDNRVAATGHAVRPPRPLGRWGSYLTGAPYPSEVEHEQR